MLYSVMIYGSEPSLDVLPDAVIDERVQAHNRFQAELKETGQLGPFARLMPTTAAVTVRRHGEKPVVMDGPFAETKEQLMGLYLVESEDLESLISLAQTLPLAEGSVEIRPVRYFEMHEPAKT